LRLHAVGIRQGLRKQALRPGRPTSMARDTVSLLGASGEGGDDSGVQRLQLEEAARFQAEQPCIDSALKNYLALHLAMGLAGSDSVSDPKPLQGCARVFLRALNRMQLPDVMEWRERHPQREDENGVSYLDRVNSFKVLGVLWRQCLDAGQKPSRLFGRSALAAVYDELEAEIFRDLPGAVSVAQPASESELRSFVASFRSTVLATQPALAADDAEDADDAKAEDGAADATEVSAGEDAELVWADNFRSVLLARQAARKAEAAQRVEREVSTDDFMAQMRAALGGVSAAASSSSGPTIEAVDDHA